MRITNTILSEPIEDEQDADDRASAEVRASASDEQGMSRDAAADDVDREYSSRAFRRSSQRPDELDEATPVRGRVGDGAVITTEETPDHARHEYRARIRKLIEEGKSKKTPKLILQIWQSDYSIIAFALVIASFYLMKDARYPPIGVLFFLLAMATVDAILSIFVVRLSFHQNKHGFYRTEDFERDWLRYRILLSMTKAALLFLVATTCGTAAVIGSYFVWFFTSTQRLRYFILRWSMDDHYPELQRFSIFTLLREFGIGPKLKNFNLLAVLGVLIGFAIAFVF